MTMLAQKCVPVSSSWVHQFIWMCDDRLAVQFKNGVCCYYPNTNKNFFQLALVWGSPGKFVHKWLFKKQPYKLIKPPCPAQDCGVTTGCCGNPVPTTVHATVSGAGIVNGVYPMIYDAVSQQWNYNDDPLGSCILLGEHLTLSCDSSGPVWKLLLMDNISSPYHPTGPVCSPLSLVFNTVDFTLCGGGSSGTITVTA